MDCITVTELTVRFCVSSTALFSPHHPKKKLDQEQRSNTQLFLQQRFEEGLLLSSLKLSEYGTSCVFSHYRCSSSLSLLPHIYTFFWAQGHVMLEITGYSLSRVTCCCSAGRNLSCSGVSLPLPGIPQLLYKVIELDRACSFAPGNGAAASSCGMSPASSVLCGTKSRSNICTVQQICQAEARSYRGEHFFQRRP